MRTKNREYFENGLAIATVIVLISNLFVYYGDGSIAMGVINSIVLAGYVLLFLVDLLS